jgi:cytochrome c oxidase subunit 4
MGYGLFNLGSLLLGIVALVLPFINFFTRDKTANQKKTVVIASSIGACAMSLFFQLIYQRHLVDIEDWSALMDTSGAVVFVSAVLLTIVFALNLAFIVSYSKNYRK